MTRFVIHACLAAAAGLSPAGATGPVREWFRHSAERAWLEDYDPTLISDRMLSELSYEDYEDDVANLKLETSFRWGIPVAEDLALGVQAMVPLKWADDGAEEDSGLGDLELRGGLAGRFSPGLRWAFALNAAFETATDPAIGGHIFELRPIAALRWDMSERSNLGINIEYNFTPKDEGGDDESALEVKVPLAFKISEDWSAALTYKPRWNLLDETDRHRLELGATRVWGPDRQFAWSFGIELPLTGESFRCKVLSGFTCNF